MTGVDPDPERAITRVLFDYCDAVDANQSERIVALFTEDAVFDFGYGRLFTGHDQLRAMFAGLDTYSATSHHLSNVRVDVEAAALPARATARSRVIAFHRNAADGRVAYLWGSYDDLFERRGPGWLIARRTLRAAAEVGTEPPPGLPTRWEPIPRRGS